MLEYIRKIDLKNYDSKPVFVVKSTDGGKNFNSEHSIREWCIGKYVDYDGTFGWFEATNKDGKLYRDKYGVEWVAYENDPNANMGNVSDGYHTFNDLYHHRAVLFSVICSQFKNLAWKSKKHNDGTMFDGMFIVGINTPKGQATYHYDIEPYWKMFDVLSLDYSPRWDGHTPEEAIERISSLITEVDYDNRDIVVSEFEKVLQNNISYDEWAGREYGETKVDHYFTAIQLLESGYGNVKKFAKEVKESASHGWTKSIDKIEKEILGE